MSIELVTPDEFIVSKIYFIRGKKVMIDRDLALLYGVKTKVLNQMVKRNALRFPSDFMFKITREENEILRSQFVTLEKGQRKYPKYLPYAFTEMGVSMLSSVLNSDRAIEVNIQIIRIFTRLREMVLTNKDILIKLDQLENQVGRHSEEILLIFAALKELISQNDEPRPTIGYRK